ncbi:hypothetical protein Dimus_027320 [Dionaea muscipula]
MYPQRKISWVLLCIVIQLAGSDHQLKKLGVDGEPLVPCFFIFGDSLSDSGNNNNLYTAAKANFPPYGIDFPGGPTGRFTNGRTTVDLIGDYLGLENYIPAFPSAEGEQMLYGINYASGSAGIRPETGYQVGGRISMDHQLLNHKTVISRIRTMLGNNSNSTTSSHLNSCLYSVYIGSNDYMINYFNPTSITRLSSTPGQFTDALVSRLSQQLQTLYKFGARKVVLIGLGPLGCLPLFRQFGGCAGYINNVLQGYNEKLRALVDDFNQRFTDAKFIFINTIGIVGADLSGLGLRITNIPCCGAFQVVCLPFSAPCVDRNDFAYWDNAHPTEAANKVLASRAFNARDPDDAYPMDISHLAKLSLMTDGL